MGRDLGMGWKPSHGRVGWGDIIKVILVVDYKSTYSLRGDCKSPRTELGGEGDCKSPRTEHSALWILHCEFWILNCELCILHCEFWIVNCEFKIHNSSVFAHNNSLFFLFFLCLSAKMLQFASDLKQIVMYETYLYVIFAAQKCFIRALWLDTTSKQRLTDHWNKD